MMPHPAKSSIAAICESLMRIARRLVRLSLCTFLVLWTGCAWLRTAGPAPTRALGPHESANPGVNDAYFQEPDPAHWQARFEGADREVFRRRRQILGALRLQPGQSVADVGAGTGAFTTSLARRVGTGGAVYAVDIVPEFLTAIQQRASDEGTPQVHVVQCTAESIGLPPNTLDLAFLCDTYHHLEYPVDMLRSIRAALKPGGRLVVIDFEILPGPRYSWLLDHVRVDRGTVRQEILNQGFDEILDRPPARFLRENYWLEFGKPR